MALLADVAGEPLDPGWVAARAVLERRTVAVADLFGPEGDPFPASRARSSEVRARGSTGYAALACTPLLKGGQPLGVLNVLSPAPHRFTPEELALLETFAAQAAAAIENARLVSELQESNATLKEALEQQTATSEILRAIAASPADVSSVLGTICATAFRLLGSPRHVTLWLYEGDQVRRAGRMSDEAFTSPSVPVGATIPLSPHGAYLREQWRHDPTSFVVPDIQDAAVAGVRNLRENARIGGWRSMVQTPLIRGGEPLGNLSVMWRDAAAFSPEHVSLLERFADQAVIAIENARLFSELQESNRSLREALDQRTATGEVLEIIAGSPTSVEPALRAIVESGMRLCDAEQVSILELDGDVLVDTARRRRSREGEATTLLRHVAIPSIGASYRVIREARTLHIPDIPRLAASDDTAGYDRKWLIAIADSGFSTWVSTPLMRGGEPIGAIAAYRREVTRPFTPEQIALLESFASQAVIALENTRLFSELQERDERRRHELERASAIQQRLLPERVEGWPGVLEIAVRFRPAVETSGDFYDVLRFAPSSDGALPPLQIAVGDVAGKGMAAALVTALARSALHASASVPPGMAMPAATLRVAGQRLHRDVGSGHFVACALAIVEPPGLLHAGPLLRLSNAAQVPVLLVRGGTAAEIEPPGDRLPLGARSDSAYEDAKVELRPGDVVVLSSDGLVEAPALAAAAASEHLPAPQRAGELFGFARLAASASHWAAHASTAEEVAAGFWSDLTAWCGPESHHDDVTLLVLRVPG